MYLVIKWKKLVWSFGSNASFSNQYVFLIAAVIINLLLPVVLRSVFLTEACCVVIFHVSYTYLNLLHRKILLLVSLLYFN